MMLEHSVRMCQHVGDEEIERAKMQICLCDSVKGTGVPWGTTVFQACYSQKNLRVCFKEHSSDRRISMRTFYDRFNFSVSRALCFSKKSGEVIRFNPLEEVPPPGRSSSTLR